MVGFFNQQFQGWVVGLPARTSPDQTFLGFFIMGLKNKPWGQPSPKSLPSPIRWTKFHPSIQNQICFDRSHPPNSLKIGLDFGHLFRKKKNVRPCFDLYFLEGQPESKHKTRPFNSNQNKGLHQRVSGDWMLTLLLEKKHSFLSLPHIRPRVGHGDKPAKLW